MVRFRLGGIVALRVGLVREGVQSAVQVITVRISAPILWIWPAYSRCLEDFAKAGKVIDARVEGGDGVVK